MSGSFWSVGRARGAERRRIAPVPGEPGLLLRLRVRSTRRRLDREIAGHAVLDGSRARALRAIQLADPSTRTTIAAILETILSSAAERARDPCSRLVLEHDAVLDEREGILELIDLLTSGDWLSPRAVALARLLADSSASPIVSRSCGTTIGEALAEIAAAR